MQTVERKQLVAMLVIRLPAVPAVPGHYGQWWSGVVGGNFSQTRGLVTIDSWPSL